MKQNRNMNEKEEMSNFIVYTGLVTCITHLDLFILCMYAFVRVHVCMPRVCLVSTELTKRHWIPQNWNYRGL